MIAREVWKEGTGTLTNTIDVYITLLRKKIERPDKRTLIHTVRGVGYALRDGCMSRLSIRWRLTLWYGAVLAGVLAVFGTSVFLLMRRELQNRTSRALLIQMAVIEDELVRIRSHATQMEERLEQYSAASGLRYPGSGADGTIWMRSDRIRDRGLPPPGRVPEPGRRRLRKLQRRRRRPVPDAQPPDHRGAGLPLARSGGHVPGRERQGSSASCWSFCCWPAPWPWAARWAAATCWRARRWPRWTEWPPRPTRSPPASSTGGCTHPTRRRAGRLARTLNGMIARLERSFEEVRRFTADAAHELRTPLAILRNEAEVALRVPRDSEQYRECLEDMLEEIEHLSRLSEDLLLLFREDAGLGAHAKEVVHLDQLAGEIADHCGSWRPSSIRSSRSRRPPRAWSWATPRSSAGSSSAWSTTRSSSRRPEGRILLHGLR